VIAPPSLEAHVLLVGGPPLLNRALRDQLMDWGMMVATTVGGRTALRLARAATERGRPYDVVLVTRHTGSLDALEVARRLREGGLAATVPLVLVTAAELEESVVERASIWRRRSRGGWRRATGNRLLGISALDWPWPWPWTAGWSPRSESRR
jgi:CheY-like chemotaxis protein